MKRRERHILYFFLAIIDATLIVASYVAASSAYVGTLNALGRLAEYRVPLMHNAGFLSLAIYALLIVAAYAACRVYGAAYLGRIGYMARRIVAVNTIGIVLFMILPLMYYYFDQANERKEKKSIGVLIVVQSLSMIILPSTICLPQQ